MRGLRIILLLVLFGLIGFISLTSCEKENATIGVNVSGDDGDVTGNGGSATATHNWTNSQSRAEMNMDITSTSGGSMQIIVVDSEDNEVINETLTAGVGDDSKTVCSNSGTPGTWRVTIILTDFNGDGSFTLSQGC